jgi:Ethanolamine utilization protein, possible chaperonin protecting lyase from inhibition
MGETFLSVGIDIGTTTTQIVFSRLTIEQQQIQNSGKATISDREIIYRSAIYYTPLSSPSKVNSRAIANIIKAEYKLAGFSPSDIHSGAVIITGETARKENALAISNTLSLAAGKFVVATAGPELEAILSGQGAGAAQMSEKITDKVINFDIGGGTTNVSVFFNGQAETPFALDIGGRLIKFSVNRTITYISPRLKPLINALNIPLYIGFQCNLADIYTLCRQLAAILLDYTNGSKGGIYGKDLLITAAPRSQHYHTVMFSGGVAEYIYHPIADISWESILKFQDIGIILGKCINELFLSSGLQILQPKETIRATVIGAGIYSMSISGSTVNIDEEILPLRDIPVIKLQENIFYLPNADKFIAEKLAVYKESSVAIAFAGPKSPSYNELKAIAKCLATADALIHLESNPLIVVLEHDFAKALGQTLRPLLPLKKKVVCIDRIAVKESSYIDIGRPIGNVLPVVIKTLAFH